MIILIGSSGAIGRVLYNELLKVGMQVTPVSDYENNAITYKELFENNNKLEIDLIIDCSKKDFKHYLQLYENFNKVPIVHFSTNRLNFNIKFDQYDYYKLDVLKIIKAFDKPHIIWGDLFCYDNDYLGYWSILNKNSKLITYRTVRNTSIELIVDGIKKGSLENIYSEVKTIKTSYKLINLLIVTKLFKLLEIFNYHVIK